MEIVILGSGRLGARLTNTLGPFGHHVLIVDDDETKFKNLDEYPNVEPIKGNIFNENLAESIFSGHVDVFIVLTGNDNINVMVAQALQKKYHIPRVLVRIFDPTLAKVYNDLGLETICPTDSAVKELMGLLKKGC